MTDLAASGTGSASVTSSATKATSSGSGSTPPSVVTTAISLYFKLSLEYDTGGSATSLGVFTDCQGLGCEMTVLKREEGGVNDFVHHLPGPVKYSNVTLKRPVTKENQTNQNIVDWITMMHRTPKPGRAVINALDSQGKELFSWTLMNVVPVKWKGPSFSIDSAKVAEESIEIAHEGFLAR